ncbi:MAG TPA: glycosyltransferase family 9 protein [Blastocatellia bacterium]|nr:glycosyltransferase family 9 protein [Blastocatellia bacterium]
MNDELPATLASSTLNPQPATPSKVLVRVPNWVGDAVMALPALRELRRIFEGSLVTLAARPWVAGLFEGEALADTIIPFHDTSGLLNRARHFVSTAGQLRRERFDYAVLLPNSFGSAVAARAGGAKNIAGYPTDGRRRLLDHIIPFEPNHKKLHQVRYYLNIAAQIEGKLTGASRVDFEHCEPRLHVDETQRDRARFLLERFGIKTVVGDRCPAVGKEQLAPDARPAQNEADGEAAAAGGNVSLTTDSRRILAINPGATNSTAKRWPAERFAETADRLSDEFQTVIVGTESDKEVSDKVAALMSTRAVVLAGETSIGELKAVLACAELVVSNDTGAAHVSAALGVPTIVVFGPTEHIATRPLAKHAAVVRHDVECSPCMLRECPIDHRCMTRVQVEDVYRAARQLLARAQN